MDEMGEQRPRMREMRNAYMWRDKHTWIHRWRWGDNITIDPKEMRCEGEDCISQLWIGSSSGGILWTRYWSFEFNFFHSLATISFSTRNLFVTVRHSYCLYSYFMTLYKDSWGRVGFYENILIADWHRWITTRQPRLEPTPPECQFRLCQIAVDYSHKLHKLLKACRFKE
jgi:hypothetical protein